MKKRMILWTLVLLILLLPTAQVFAEDKEDAYAYYEYAILARNPDVHGKYMCFRGYLGEAQEDGCCVFHRNWDFYDDIYENAIWIDGSIVDLLLYSYQKDNYLEDPENYMKKSLGRTIDVCGYVNLNNRGPDGKYAATLQPEPVTEPFVETTPRREITGGETQEDAIEMPVIRLFGDPWRYMGKWVTVSGDYRSSTDTASFGPMFRWENYPGCFIPIEGVDKDAYKKVFNPYVKDIKDYFISPDPKWIFVFRSVMTITGKVTEVPSSYYGMALGFSKVVDFVLHPLSKKDLDNHIFTFNDEI